VSLNEERGWGKKKEKEAKKISEILEPTAPFDTCKRVNELKKDRGSENEKKIRCPVNGKGKFALGEKRDTGYIGIYQCSEQAKCGKRNSYAVFTTTDKGNEAEAE